jgi:hypothetical protein
MNTNTIPQHTATVDLGTVIIAGTVYAVTEAHFSSYTDGITGDERPASSNVTLTGPRGAAYFLRGFTGPDTGLRQVISWKSGQPLRKNGNEIRVIRIGDVIETA